MRELNLQIGAEATRIIIGHNLGPLKNFFDQNVLLVAEQSLCSSHAASLEGLPLLRFDGTEQCKDLKQLEKLYMLFMQHAVTKDHTILAFGGGALLDLVGFAAATYLRGVKYANAASSLLAQVDGAMGGKNGINLAGHKNQIGSIRQPVLSIFDVDWLRTLTARQFSCGMAEVIKHAFIADRELLQFLNRESASILKRDPQLLQELVYRSAKIKLSFVEKDLHDQDCRIALNFGHTIGHALEVTQDLEHGEAIGLGMLLEGKLSMQRGLLTREEYKQMQASLQTFGLPTEICPQAAKLMPEICLDKKRSDTTIKSALLAGLGAYRLEQIALAEFEGVLRS